jgi:hypothetical protein
MKKLKILQTFWIGKIQIVLNKGVYMSLFDFLKDKNKKTFYLGFAYTHPLVTFDIKNKTATFSSGITKYQVFSVSQISGLNIESIGFGKMAVVVLSNGLPVYKAEGTNISQTSVDECMEFVLEMQKG